MAYTTIDDPSEHFQVDLWTSTASSQAVTNDGNSDLQGDMLILIARNLTQNKRVHDTTRGNLPAYLDLAGAWSQAQQKVISYDESSGSTFANNYDVEFDSDGYTVGSAYVSGHWATPQWKANGGSTSSNTDGTITSTVQADTTAGFSIVKYAGTGTAGTIGHGLGAVPKMIWIKHRGPAGGHGDERPEIDGEDWAVWHKALSSSAHSIDISRGDVESDTDDFWDSTYPTSSVFSVAGSSDEVNSTHSNDSDGYMAYCWTDIQGYSKFGRWMGDGNDGNGPFIYTGFRPEFILIRGIDGDTSMHVLDGRRVKDHDGTDAQYNPVRERQSLTGASWGASHTAYDTLDIYANGFKILGLPSYYPINKTGIQYLYAAWAKHPFVTSTGITGTARQEKNYVGFSRK